VKGLRGQRCTRHREDQGLTGFITICKLPLSQIGGRLHEPLILMRSVRGKQQREKRADVDSGWAGSS
jgi:hypothetical protein